MKTVFPPDIYQPGQTITVSGKGPRHLNLLSIFYYRILPMFITGYTKKNTGFPKF